MLRDASSSGDLPSAREGAPRTALAIAMLPVVIAAALLVEQAVSLVSTNEDTPGCAELLELTIAAQDCDPKVLELASQTLAGNGTRRPDEARCRALWTELIHGPAKPGPYAGQSLFDIRRPRPGPKTADAKALYGALAGQLYLSPVDPIPAGQALPRLRIDHQAAKVDDGGRSSSYLRPGRHDLEVYFSGREAEYCLDMPVCGQIELHSQGVALGPHPALQSGRCVPAS